jgi:hypothetical protein
MRAFLSSAVAASAVILSLAPTAANAATAAGLKIDHRTSAIYQYDPSPVGDGPGYDTVTVYTQLRNCPVGNYVLEMSLVQDGVSYPLASSANGVGEFSCTATNAQPRVDMAFYGNGLHPGTALARVTVYREVDNMPVLAKGSATVRIPAGANNQP